MVGKPSQKTLFYLATIPDEQVLEMTKHGDVTEMFVAALILSKRGWTEEMWIEIGNDDGG